MPTLSKKCHKSTKEYHCNFCHHTIPKGHLYFRLFGMAFLGDKPYEVFMCLPCDISKVEENKEVGKETNHER